MPRLARHSGIGLSGGTVSNATSLNGGWDFTLVYSTDTRQQMPRSENAESASGGAVAAPDPTAGYSIFEAMEKQLGLKLATTRGVRPVTVIDHIQEKPVDE